MRVTLCQCDAPLPHKFAVRLRMAVSFHVVLGCCLIWYRGSAPAAPALAFAIALGMGMTELTRWRRWFVIKQVCPTAVPSCRVVPAQAKYIQFGANCRFHPVVQTSATGVVVLVDMRPDEPAEYIDKQGGANAAPSATVPAQVGGADDASEAPAAQAAPQQEPDAPDDMDLE